jgi:hypothetical protein
MALSDESVLWLGRVCSTAGRPVPFPVIHVALR